MILVRVYGILKNEAGEVLITHERYGSHAMTKFPGGGLEYGEGTKECLVREFKEELGVDIEVLEHLYTTDFFQKSAFHERAQVLSIYYLVKAVGPVQVDIKDTHIISAQFVGIRQLERVVTLPIDLLIARMLADGGYTERHGEGTEGTRL